MKSVKEKGSCTVQPDHKECIVYTHAEGSCWQNSPTPFLWYFLHYQTVGKKCPLKKYISSSLKTQESQYHFLYIVVWYSFFLCNFMNFYLHTAIDRHLSSIEECSTAVEETRNQSLITNYCYLCFDMIWWKPFRGRED